MHFSRIPLWLRSALLCTLVCLVILPVCLPALTADVEAAGFTDATVKKYEEQLKIIAAEKAAVYSQLSSSLKDQSDALAIKQLLDRQHNLVIDEIETYDELIAETERRIGEKTLEIIDKKAEVDTQKDNFLTRLRLTYEEGNVGYLEMIFGAENLYDFLTRAERIGNMLDYDIRMMNQYQDACDALKAAEEELEAAQLLQQEALARQEERKRELEADILNNEVELQKLMSAIYEDRTEYAKLVEREAAVNKEMEAYIKEQQAKLNAQYVGGEFIWPLDVNKWKRISSYFGPRTLWGVPDNHTGIDIPAYAGEYIYASNGGTVITSAFHWSYGNYIIIDHGGGKSTLYAHASARLVEKGAVVKQGQPIARVGTTGSSTGNHLHFEIRIGGKCENPLNHVTQPK
ncbi:MAG: peptidoglycan DD-metalloendopeptidase family protein [Clostridia bacterium]|nr:peptidoglycan DD-metalloendopeptidase family protein [Clostridia bacterium]